MSRSLPMNLLPALSVFALLVGCSTTPPASQRPATSTAPAATSVPTASAPQNPSPSAAAGLPPFGDVPFYRVDLAGSVEEPGPGPSSTPQLAWKVALGPTATGPILTGGLLVVADNATHSYVALDARTGTEKWRFETGPTDVEFGSRSAAAADGLVFLGDSDAVYAVDPATGAQRWKAATSQNRLSRLLITDGVLYIGTVGGAVGLDDKTGQEVWRWEGPADLGAQVGAIADGVAYINVNNGRLYAIDTHDATQKWEFQARGTGLGSPLVAGATIYTYTVGESAEPTGELYAIDRATGAVRWRYSGPSGGQLTAGPARDGIVYVSGENEGIYALRDDGNIASIVWNTPAPKTFFPMSIAGDVLFEPRFDGSIGAYGVADGHLLWETPALGDNGGGPPLVSGGMVFEVNQAAGVVAYADPALIALLPRPGVTGGPVSSASPSPAALGPDPFTIVKALSWSTTKIAIPLGIAGGADGLLYVLDTKPSVSVIDPSDGHVVRTWGRQGTGKGEFDLSEPTDNPGAGDIAVDGAGLVYVADGSNYRVQVFTADGSFVRQFGSFGTGPGQLGRIHLIGIARDGSIYLAFDDHMDAFSPEGKFKWRVGHTPDYPYGASDAAVLSDGTVMTSSEQCSCVIFLDPADGHMLKKVDVPQMAVEGDGFGTLSVDPEDHIYVDVYGSEAKLILDKDGNYIAGKFIQPGEQKYVVGKSVVWSSDMFYMPPAFLPDGRGFAFMKEGLVELKVMLPD